MAGQPGAWHAKKICFICLLAGPCREATVAALLASRDLRTTIGANLALARNMAGLDPWTTSKNVLRAGLEAAERATVPPMYEWRTPALEKFLAASLTAGYQADQVEVDRLGELINSLVIN